MQRTIDAILRTREGSIRVVWRFLALVVPITAFGTVIRELPYAQALWREYFAIALVLLSMALLRLGRKPLALLGLSWTSASRRHVWWGLAIGSLLAASAVAIASLGGMSFTVLAREPRGAISILVTEFAAFGVGALFEEVLVHGYLFQLALEHLSGWTATLLLAVVFASMHLMNPHVTILGTVNTFLAGVLFGMSFLRTRQLWLPIAMHAAWNVVEGTVLGTPVSGNRSPGIIRITLQGFEWLTGSDYGVEAGLAGTIVLVLGLLLVAGSSALRMAPEQFALLHRIRYDADRARLLRDMAHA
jgi:membrane protease YdiL (CAAX protease family)